MPLRLVAVADGRALVEAANMVVRDAVTRHLFVPVQAALLPATGHPLVVPPGDRRAIAIRVMAGQAATRMRGYPQFCGDPVRGMGTSRGRTGDGLPYALPPSWHMLPLP